MKTRNLFVATLVASGLAVSLSVPGNARAALPEAPSSARPACAPVPPGLVSWWRAEGNTVDVTGANPGLVSSVVGYRPGKVGQAFDFDGKTSFIQLANSPSLNPRGSFTIEGWIYPREDQANHIFTEWNGSGDNMCYGLGTQADRGLGFAVTDLAHEWDSSFHNFYVTRVLTLNAWNHVAAVYDQSSGTRLIYVNGVEAGRRTDLPIVVRQGTAPTMIGAARPGAYVFNGMIDEIAFYSRALSAAEIETLYGAGSAGKCSLAAEPSITAQPASQTVTVGGSATFTVGASGSAPLGYQWRFFGTNLLEQGGSSHSLTNAQLADTGWYSVIVNNAAGSAVSSNAVLKVVPVPTCTPAPAGLAGWWRAEGNAEDTVGSSAGTLVGGAEFTVGKVGRAFHFGQTGAAVALGNPASLQLQNFTLEAWVKRDSASRASTDAGTAGHILGGAAGGYGLGMSDDGSVWLSKLGGGSVQSRSKVSDAEDFHHLVVTKSGSTVVFYIDGRADTAAPFDPGFVFDNGGFAIGARGSDYAGSFRGTIDEASIYKRALTAAEAQALYVADSAGKCGWPVAPGIMTQPASETVSVRERVTLTVNANGSRPLAYQWRWYGTNLAGQTSS
jgi:hypothetical protein